MVSAPAPQVTAHRRTGRTTRRVVAGLVALLVTVSGCSTADGSTEAATPAGSATSAAVKSEPSSPAPAPAAAPTALPVAAMSASVPLRVEVPTIGVDSELMALGLLADGSLEVPPGAFPAGWFTGAPTPGEIGPAVIAGHIDWVTGPGVFHQLAALEVGAEIRVSRTDGSVAVFRTTEVTRYPKDAFPTELVYGDIDHAGLRLISCGGAFNSATGHYEDNIVAFAELVT
ncbi:class F sortase [Sanguibacter sp. 25GB23B1]|uniref:class F sortase n=1 Tax=unclassified Sanguibacter TaxID=2645534 RepID=UPI0032AFB098